jgi:hypothetical protein
MEELVALAQPFIAIIILSAIVDSMTSILERIMKYVPGLPDQFEWYVGYAIVLLFSYFITLEGNFDFFAHFGFNFNEEWEANLMTALIISGGSNFLMKQFTLLENLPSILSEFKSTLTKVGKK